MYSYHIGNNDKEAVPPKGSLFSLLIGYLLFQYPHNAIIIILTPKLSF